ncbi:MULTISPECIES: PAS domain S-box protein [Halomonadaceae]|uniref:histidine kinase n=1 Tax=Vreelandella halophila TaxID=86177 RepID=A0A9X4YDN9_9GAMM|nr:MULTISPECIES: PAS domain S-box protein [Halomonas]MYL27393.1 PAS domain S-box protein [Halomonas utahensis]MYL74519.1 PAS domain S-box protein [Halomonas sp. 22501_18_FS]
MTGKHFQSAPLPHDEPGRVQALARLESLDAPPDHEFDDLVHIAAQLCDTPIALVSLVDADRQWFRASCGLDERQTGREESFCAHAIHSVEVLEVCDTQKDDRFADNPLVTGPPGIRYYAGAPLVGQSGHAYGTLCVIDTRPRDKLSDGQQDSLQRLARLTVERLEEWVRKQQADINARTLSVLLDSMPDATVSCDREGNLAQFNSKAREWHGVDPRALPAEQWSEHFNLYEPDGETPLATEHIPLLRAWRGEQVRNAEIVIQAHDQAPRVVLCNGERLEHDSGGSLGAVVTMSDITSLRHAYSDLNRTRAYPQSVIDASVNVAIIATNPQGLITLFNPGAETLLGYQAEKLVNLHTPALFHLASEIEQRGDRLREEFGEPFQGFDVFVEKARQGTPETLTWTYVRKDGQHRQVQLAVSAMRDDAGTINGFLGMAVDITERLRAEKEARLAKDRFSEAFNSAALGMALVSLEGGWLDVNEAIPTLFGYSREEILKTDFQSLTHPDDLDTDLALLKDLLAGRISHYQMKKRYYRQDGSIMHALLSVGLVTNDNGEPLHFVSQIQDVSSEHHAIEELEANRQFLQQLFDSLVDAVLVLDSDTTIITHNRAATELLELPTDAIGSRLSSRLPELTERLATEEAAPCEERSNESLLARWNTSLAIPGKASTPLELSLSRTHGQYDPLHRWVLVARDLTENQRNEQLKNEFVSTISHELRTPLAAISGSLRLITGGAVGEVPARMEKMLRIAEQNSHRLIQLVNDLLDLNRLAAGEMDLSFQDVELAPLIDQAIEQMQSFAEPYEVILKRTGSSDGQVCVDPRRLQQILANLISNACKHSPRGAGVTIHCESSAEGRALVSVIDQGPGIPESFRSRIFERFAQADASDSRAKGGTGLGLAVTRELVERMGGIIGFESREGEGARFWFRFPRAMPEPIKPHGKARILHVEDDTDLATVVAAQLEPWSRVERAVSLRQAHECLRQASYDLILLDLKLDDGSGIELWESLHRAQPEVPVMILSGYEVPRRIASRVAAVVNKASVTPGEIEKRAVELIKSVQEKPQTD